MNCGRSLTAGGFFAVFVAAIFVGCGSAGGAGGAAGAGFPVTYRNPGTKATAFGDSITFGVGASAEQKRYPNIIAQAVGWTLTNKAISGSAIADQVPAIYSESVEPDGNSVILTGYNDMRHFGTDNEGIVFYRNALYPALAWLAIPERRKVRASDNNVTYLGPWAAFPAYGYLGRYATQRNASAAFTVDGTGIYICGMATYNSTGTFTASVDGVEKETRTCSASRTPGGGSPYSPFLVRIAGLADGPHAVVLTVTSDEGEVFFDWAAGVGGAASPSAKPNVFVGNTLRMRSSAYALGGQGIDAGSDAAVALFNATIRSVCADLVADGLGVYHVDASGSYDPNGPDVSPDLVHPSDQGMAKIAAAFLAQMR
jgi:lysophospholipase L1-like esterase